MSETLIQIGRQTNAPTPRRETRREPRPEWLRIRLATPASYHKVRELVDRLSLHTVCQEARCPNIYECWGEHGTATFMILGDVCTRRCGFCAVTSGRPQAGVDPEEPAHLAEAVRVMGLRHAVITSVRSEEHTSELSHGYISYAVFCLKKKKRRRQRRARDRSG